MPVEFGWLTAGAIGLFLGLVAGLALRSRMVARLNEELRIARIELKDQSRLEQERDQAMHLAMERLGSAFDELADRQFRSHSDTFLKLARESLGIQQERAKGELAQREQAIENLVRPIREALARTEAQLHEFDKARRDAHSTLTTQLQAIAVSHQSLAAETRNLVNALRRPEVRGQWGELTLRRLVELAGMVEHCDFVSQSHQATEDGAIRPDMVVNLPEGRQLVIDVKTPLDAYLEAAQAETEQERRAAYARHAGTLADRIRELAGKSYWSQFERSPDFVILFIPGDQILSTALTQRPTLLDDALRQNIILATPTSLVALLKAVAYGWQQVALAENAAEIRGLAVQLYERLVTFTGHLAQMGKELGDCIRAYNRGVGSLERMVLPAARRFTELGVKPRTELGDLPAIDDSPRDMSRAMAASQSDDHAFKNHSTPPVSDQAQHEPQDDTEPDQ